MDADKKLVRTDNCPQCGLPDLFVYALPSGGYLCQCQNCGIFGEGQSQKDAIKKTENCIGDCLDWRSRVNPVGKEIVELARLIKLKHVSGDYVVDALLGIEERLKKLEKSQPDFYSTLSHLEFSILEEVGKSLDSMLSYYSKEVGIERINRQHIKSIRESAESIRPITELSLQELKLTIVQNSCRREEAKVEYAKRQVIERIGTNYDVSEKNAVDFDEWREQS